MSFPNSNAYNLGFLALSLRPELARIFAQCYLSTGDWLLAKQQVLATNAFQVSNTNSAVRMEREIRQRISTLTHEQVEILVHATTEERTAMTWLAACKDIAFASDFTVEILREKWVAQDPVLRPSDYEEFIRLKSVSHAELSSLTEKSKQKVRQVLFHMLKEAGLLIKGEGWGTIQRPVLSTRVQRAIVMDDPRWLAVFLVTDAEIAAL